MKKIISIILTVAFLISAFAIGADAAKIKNLDLAFVIDTTGSMSDDINRVKQDMTQYLSALKENGLVNYRVAIVDYRDFSSRTGSSGDYPYKIQLDFTNDYESIISAINGLTLGAGGDYEETVCSALIDGLSELSWRSEAGKAAILMGDAPALDPEPITNYTKDMAINKLVTDNTGYVEDMGETRAAYYALDSQASLRSKVTLFTIATSSYSETIECFNYLAEGTGGESYIAENSEDISNIMTEIIETIPEVVEENELSFWQKIGRFFKILWYIITFQWDKI